MADAILEIRGLRLSIATDEGLAKILDHIDFTLERGHISWGGR
jgi:ABC-type antimicrobial peptide transport system ATPase subunit